MGKVNKVVAVGRQVFRNNAKNIKPRKREKFNKNEQPVSHSHRIEGTAQKKGTKPVMSNKQKQNPVSFRGGDYKETSDAVDERANPFWHKVI